MKTLLQKYITALRENGWVGNGLKEQEKVLLKPLLSAILPDGTKISDVILSGPAYVREQIQENMPNDATDHEVCIVAHYIKDKLKFIKLDEDKDAVREYCAIHDDGLVCANDPQLPRYWGELTM